VEAKQAQGGEAVAQGQGEGAAFMQGMPAGADGQAARLALRGDGRAGAQDKRPLTALGVAELDRSGREGKLGDENLEDGTGLIGKIHFRGAENLHDLTQQIWSLNAHANASQRRG